MKTEPAIEQAFLCPKFRSRAMSLSCPFCHSPNLMLVEASTQQSNTALSSLGTPATLAALGATVAKSFNLPPIVGGIAGTVLGSVLNAFTEPSAPTHQNLCFCHNCYQKFPSHLLH
ncbi:hypothetical protein F889_03018 [Acinetobacter colistiniresistens]|uniref:Uncharacterized protein n=2 Tax=Acinetobacter colistiniresistens TaxID=280145 RepID=N9QSU4_9GAMM|nr:hypothetical protein F889_03018 [Acinetobacter colistiniresistens]